MPKFRKKPVVVEAVQFDGNRQHDPPYVKRNWDNNPLTPYKASVLTINGQWVTVVPGDWIITEPDGTHHYPCKPDIFEKTYEPAENMGDPEKTFTTLVGLSKEGKITIPVEEGYYGNVCNIEEFITQPIEGMLYDLGLLEEGIDVSTVQGVRLFAIAQVIRALKEKTEENMATILKDGE